jgi:hypothetical protein
VQFEINSFGLIAPSQDDIFPVCPGVLNRSIFAIYREERNIMIAGNFFDLLVVMIILSQCSCCTLIVIETVDIKVTSAAAAFLLSLVAA